MTSLLGTKLYHQALAELCKPLADYVGLSKAYYINIDTQGKAMMVTTDVAWMERVVEQHYYRLDHVMVHPDRIQTGFAFHSCSEDKEYKDTMFYEATVHFNWYHSFVYIEKTPNKGFWSLGFATDKDNTQVPNELFNKGPIIKTAVRELHQRLSLTIGPNMKEQRVDLAALKGEAFYTQPGLLFDEQYATKQQLHRLKTAFFC